MVCSFYQWETQKSHPNQRIDHEQPDQSWSCEMAIPFSDYIATTNTPQKKKGDKWRLNLLSYRAGENHKGRRILDMVTNPKDRLSSSTTLWCPQIYRT